MIAHSLLWLWLQFISASLTSSVAITGTQGGVDNSTGVRPFRLEISTFQNVGASWDLYILALQQYQQMNQSQQLSYYQVAGIHGYPNVPWDNAVGSGGSVGYCTHGSILFAMWHRPYMALIERTLWDNAQRIAQQYPPEQQAIYQQAAITFRIPYWDWSLNNTMPDIINSPTITVNTPQGSKEISNPLYSYTFHPLVPSDLPDLSQYNTTVRTPDPVTKQSQPSVANQALQNVAYYFHDEPYTLLASQPDYQQFSNIGGGASQSLETVHGGIHDLVGGLNDETGHMTLFWYSAFDPVFWLHHVNVDRLIGIWQALYPDSFAVPQASTQSTYWSPAGTIEDANTPLAPFRTNNNGTFHTSNSARYIKSFGYTYPELLDWTATSPEQFSSQVRGIVNQLYHPGFSLSIKPVARGVAIGAALAADWEWMLDIRANGSNIPSPLTLYFFTSDPALSTPPSSWPTSPSLIGHQSLSFRAPQTTRQGATSAYVVGSVPLTHSLLAAIGTLDPGTVMPYLKKNIVWKAVSADNAVVGKAELGRSVKVKVMGRTIRQPNEAHDFPSYGKWKDYAKEYLGAMGDHVV